MKKNEKEEEYITMEQLFAESEEEDRKKNFRNWLNRRFPKGYAGNNCFYILLHPWEILRYWKSQIIWAHQRVFRGWDDRAVWSIDWYLARIIPEMVKKLKKDKPVELDL